ncbi:MAG: NADH-quinone oxidoreductase subunit C, partial [Myxococcota bacterium]
MTEDFGSTALRRLIDEFGDVVRETHANLGDATASVEAGRVGDVLRFLRDEADFDMLMDVTCVDYLGETPRFEMVYHLYSLDGNERVRVKARVAEESPTIASVTPLYASANWMEREVWDLYGIAFDGHPDPRRILLYDEFEEHPLRKDYPKEKRQPLV